MFGGGASRHTLRVRRRLKYAAHRADGLAPCLGTLAAVARALERAAASAFAAPHDMQDRVRIQRRRWVDGDEVLLGRLLADKRLRRTQAQRAPSSI